MNDAKMLFQQQLKSHSLSVTKPRMLVFEALYVYGLQTPAMLVEKCPDADRASVYRAVDTLQRIGAVHRVPQGLRYKLELSEMFLPHHHHITCISCGNHQSIEQATLEKILVSIAEKESFHLTSHKVELSGLCAKCQDKTSHT